MIAVAGILTPSLRWKMPHLQLTPKILLITETGVFREHGGAGVAT